MKRKKKRKNKERVKLGNGERSVRQNRVGIILGAKAMIEVIGLS